MVAKLQNEELVAQAIEILAKPAFKTKILSMLNEPGISCVNSKVGYGSTSIDSVNEQIKNLKNVIRDNNG